MHPYCKALEIFFSSRTVKGAQVNKGTAVRAALTEANAAVLRLRPHPAQNSLSCVTVNKEILDRTVAFQRHREM